RPVEVLFERSCRYNGHDAAALMGATLLGGRPERRVRGISRPGVAGYPGRQPISPVRTAAVKAFQAGMGTASMLVGFLESRTATVPAVMATSMQFALSVLQLLLRQRAPPTSSARIPGSSRGTNGPAQPAVSA